MTFNATTADRGIRGAFRHEIVLYGGRPDLVEGVAGFVADGVRAGEPVCVMVPPATLTGLRRRLGAIADDHRVVLADMSEVGRNPGRIISAWHDFAALHGAGGRPLRGVGQPVWDGRSAAELDECLHHEHLLNLAFDGGPPLWLICPYDTASLPAAIVDAAIARHPYVRGHPGHPGHAVDGSRDRRPPPGARSPNSLAPPPEGTRAMPVERGNLAAVRRAVRAHAAAAGLPRTRTAELILAVSELATNSVRHGGGRATLTSWSTAEGVVHEVRDAGWIDRPLAGRIRPTRNQPHGWGLWLVHQLCDLVQVRSSPAGTVVRVTMRHRTPRSRPR